MPVSYPENWVSRVQSSPKLVLSPAEGRYTSPDGRQAVSPQDVARRTEQYLRAEAQRRKLRKLNRDDERVCQDFVLLVENWRTGAWDVPAAPPTWTHARKKTKSATRSRTEGS